MSWAFGGRLWASLIVVVLISATGCGGDPPAAADTTGAGASAEPDAEAPARPVLSKCGELPVISGFRCGSIDVPVFRSDLSFGETEVGFAVRRHDASGPADGTIVAVEGGPGYSSTGTANAFTKAFGSLLESRDLVLVDQRGTGRSKSVGCPDIQRARAPGWLAAADCAARLGPEFESYTTAAAAADVNAVREALGLGEITLYGDSYGTYLGQAYAYRYPETLEALVLDSAYPIRGEAAWYPSLPKTGIRALGIACDREPSCPGDAVARLDRLARFLRETGRGVGPLLDAIAEAGAYGAPGSYLAIDRAGRQLLAGHPAAYRALIREEKPALKHPRQYAKAIEYIVGCNDYPMIWDRRADEFQRRAQLQESIRAHNRETFEPFTAREVALSSELGYLECLAWPQPTDRREPPIRREMQPTEAPVLVLAGELDDVTTPIEGRRVAEQFPDARFELIPDASHVDALYFAHGEAATTMRRFLREVYAPG